MTRIHKLLQPGRASIRILNSERECSVVTPVSRAGKLRNRHELDSANSRFGQFIKVWNDSFERSLSRERADMQFIDDVVFDGESEPVQILPIELPIDDLRRAVHSVGLVA